MCFATISLVIFLKPNTPCTMTLSGLKPISFSGIRLYFKSNSNAFSQTYALAGLKKSSPRYFTRVVVSLRYSWDILCTWTVSYKNISPCWGEVGTHAWLFGSRDRGPFSISSGACHLIAYVASLHEWTCFLYFSNVTGFLSYCFSINNRLA